MRLFWGLLKLFEIFKVFLMNCSKKLSLKGILNIFPTL